MLGYFHAAVRIIVIIRASRWVRITSHLARIFDADAFRRLVGNTCADGGVAMCGMKASQQSSKQCVSRVHATYSISESRVERVEDR